MKNRIPFIFCFFLLVSVSYSQSSQLNILGTGGKFYLDHTVVAKENWYSIGRLYNLPPHDIALYNNLNFDKALDIGQQVHIPLTPANFDQKAVKSTGESLIPVYHRVLDKEWAFKISSLYNDVPVTSLEKWNKIKRDEVKPGTNLIVGFLKVKTDLSPLAMGINANPAVPVTSANIQNKSEKPAENGSVPPSNKGTAATTAATGSPVVVKNTNQPISTATPSTSTAIPVSNNPDKTNSYAATHSSGGFFSADFTGGGKSANGQAGTFKSTSGWTDGKYYALMNGIPVGTIIRISGSNGKSIYAKVLGQLPDMKESNGLLVRVSNAGSAELGLGEGKFPVDIKY